MHYLSNLWAALDFGSLLSMVTRLAAVLLCLLFSPLVSLRQLFGIEGCSLIEILDGENAQQSAIIMGVIAIVLAAASQLAVKMADMLARSREGSAE